jgi:serine/threonine protein kinase/dipeptidyl aminopeptidase/acylaminoacyl peptidase
LLESFHLHLHGVDKNSESPEENRRVAIEAGQQLLHYRLVSKIGEGGMGVVWKAVDQILDREVAIKVLPERLAEDTERLARFEREAKLLASLNHPNIATVHGLHESERVRFLTMELVEGEDLDQRLRRRPLSVADATAVARQIAEALEAAHDAGVIHRDLKPSNVRISPDGRIKVLDFGLAKALSAEPDGGAHDPAESPTVTQATAAGVILGTAGYMSPEQARGQAVDERSDIWSFGCVLWECLTGTALYGRETVTDSLGAILHIEPDWELLPTDTPPNLRRLLQRCLAKDPRARLHHIADARIELEEEVNEKPPPTTEGAVHRYRIGLAVLAIALAASLTAVLVSYLRPTADRSDSGDDNPLAGARFSKLTDFPGAEFDAAISPDGRFVAFVSDRDGPFQIFIGQIGAGEFRNLASGAEQFPLEDARAPVRGVGFNGDGSEILLGGGPWRRVRSIPLLGGPMRNFLGEHVVNVAWSPDGEHIAYHERLAGDPLYISDRNGANSRLILGPPAGTHQHYPTWSIDGQWIYLVRGRPATLEMDLWRVRADGEGLEQLTQHKLDVRYPAPIDDQTVLYSARDADGAGPWLWAVDVETKISRRASVGLEQYGSVAASTDGRRLVATVQHPRAELWSVPILDHPATERDAQLFAGLPTTRALAPRFGGSSMFFLSSRGSGDGLWRLRDDKVAEIWRGSETALLEPAAVSPEGDSVALLLRGDDGWHLNVLSADGASLRVLSDKVDARGAAGWSPDGRWIVTGGSAGGVQGLFKIPVDGGVPERIADGEALNPVWSPNGDLIVYAGAQVNVVGPLVGVSPDGEPVDLPEIEIFRSGERMRFLPDGSGLVYMQRRGPSHDFWLLDLATMESRQLTRFDSPATMRSFDITPDGTRIVFDRLSEDSDIVLIELDPER